MPVYRLNDRPVFPPPGRAGKSGLLAVGGDLSPERLLAAYRAGIFPWYAEGEPLLWWSPDPRFVLFPAELRISRSMRQLLKKRPFRITFDEAFPGVIAACRKARPGQDGTWITQAMQEAYIALHKLGYAHSVEAWQEGSLAGGLYGLSIGHTFFGESMFSTKPNASKAALITLVSGLMDLRFDLIDCQVETPHLESLGARPIPRQEFMSRLRESIRHETLQGNWGTLLAPHPFPKPDT
ncbi:MAG: leucyl/phenylalanyl-tRNA--protein transferase [Thermodesulfobacteriota bacterium]